MDSLDAVAARAIVSRIADLMARKRDELIALDGAMGDGDLGLTMEKGFAAARDAVQKAEDADPGRLLVKAGMAIARAAPSTMGTLAATGFMSGGKAVMGKQSLDPADLAVFFTAFTDGIMQRGKSRPGEKTVVDVLLPASRAFSDAVAAGAGLSKAMEKLRDGASAGREAARQMIAQHGRLAYYQEQARGKDDPGCVAGTYILQGFWEQVTGAG